MDANVVNLPIGRKPSNFLVYKNKKFPIFMKIFGTFANINFDDIQPNSNIFLLSKDEERIINLNDNSIENFILYCHNRDYEINIHNVVFINFLANKFFVQELINETENFINEHQDTKEIEIQQISICNDLIDKSSIIKIENLARNLIEMINNNQRDLLSLPIPTIHLILTKYINSDNYSQENDQTIFEFLFNCLNQHGCSASPLFSLIDFGENRSEIIGRLINDYSNDFDFHFINPLFLKTLYAQNNELIQKNEEIKLKMNDFNDTIEQFKAMIIRNNEKMIGSFFYSVRNEDDLDGAIKCNGQRIEASKYSNFVENYLKNGKIMTIPLEQWEAAKSKDGCVGCFGYDMNGDAFFAPLIQAGTYMSNAVGGFISSGKKIIPKQGQFAQDQIVNIKGGFDWAAGSQGQTEVWHASGPFQKAAITKASAPEHRGKYNSHHPRGVSFDA